MSLVFFVCLFVLNEEKCSKIFIFLLVLKMRKFLFGDLETTGFQSKVHDPGDREDDPMIYKRKYKPTISYL